MKSHDDEILWRAVRAIEALGPAAAPAVPDLIQLLERSSASEPAERRTLPFDPRFGHFGADVHRAKAQRSYDLSRAQEIVRLLGSLGRAAAPSELALTRMLRESVDSARAVTGRPDPVQDAVVADLSFALGRIGSGGRSSIIAMFEANRGSGAVPAGAGARGAPALSPRTGGVRAAAGRQIGGSRPAGTAGGGGVGPLHVGSRRTARVAGARDRASLRGCSVA